MSNDAVELFWALLESSKYDQARSNVPKDFNWNVLHPTKKITLLVAACRFPDDKKEETAVLNLIEWLVRSGASLSQKCGNTTYCWTMWTDEGEEISVDYKGHSLLSYIEAWKLLFFDHQEKMNTWSAELDLLDSVMDRIARASSERQVRPRASVDEGILEIWEKFLHATASHDLDIEAADGRVTAHAQMLMEASPVVQAMLVSPMKERQTKQIKLKDTSSSAVTLFLEVLYTCSSQGDPDYKTALSALDLAHRWQVEVVVEILADFIEGLLTEETFAAIAEHAALKGLERLQKACQSFGLGNAAIQEQLGRGDFPKTVRALFQEKGFACRAVKKRKRM